MKYDTLFQLAYLSLALLLYFQGQALAQSRDASFSHDGQRIIYVSRVDGINQLFTMHPDGSNKTQVSHSKYPLYYPFFSPDDKKIVFMSLRDKETVICTMDANGSNSQCLTDETDKTADPNWSPDGEWIVYSSGKQGNNNIYLMDTEGKHQRQLTFNKASDQTPSISPDGKHIVFVSDRDGNNELYIMEVDGSNAKRLTNDPRSDRVPRWSADGKKIIWYSREPVKVAGSGQKSWSGAEIYEIELETLARKQLTHNRHRDQGPIYSPDGSSFTFTSRRTGKSEIFLMDIKNQAVKQLTGSE